MTSQFELLDPPQDAISSIQFQPNSPSRLLVSSWDRHVYLYDVIAEKGGKLVQKYEFRAPILRACFGGEGTNEIYAVGIDSNVRRLNFETGEHVVLSSHAKGVNCVAYSPETSCMISASWDSTMHIHQFISGEVATSVVNLPAKAFALSISKSKVVVAMASRIIHIYDLQNLTSTASKTPPGAPQVIEIEPWQRREASLKYMIRTIACMPDDAGYASSSIEGRVAVEWFDSSDESQARKYAFKCHRQAGQDGVDLVYPVNALDFHPSFGSFASGGGDGTVALWDGIGKRRIRLYQRYAASIAALSFSNDGKFLAIAISPGYEDESVQSETPGVVKLFIRELSETEAKGKGAK